MGGDVFAVDVFGDGGGFGGFAVLVIYKKGTEGLKFNPSVPFFVSFSFKCKK